MIPTLLFGIPGSGSMAILAGGFILIGIEPGVTMITQNLDLTFTMIWSLAIGDVAATVLCLMLANQIAKLTTIRYAYLAPRLEPTIYQTYQVYGFTFSASNRHRSGDRHGAVDPGGMAVLVQPRQDV